MHAQLEHDVGAVCFGSVDADAEERGNFLVGFTFGQELENFAFARSQAWTLRPVAIGGSACEFVLGDSAGNASGEIRLVETCGIDGGEEDTVGFILEDVSASASFHNLVNEIVRFVHGEDKDLRGRGGDAHAARGFDAVEEGHADIEDGDIRFKPGGFFDGFTAVGGFGANLPAGARLEKSAEASANYGVIIRDQDAKGWHQRSPSGRREVA